MALEDEIYFASPENDTEKATDTSLDRIETLRDGRARLLRRWHRNYCFYNNYYYDQESDVSEMDIFFTGEQGETISFSVNHFRNFANHILNIITASRPSYASMNHTRDVESRNEVRISDMLLDWVLDKFGLEEKYKRNVTQSLLFDASYLKIWWDTTAGTTVIDDEEGNPIFSGEPNYQIIHPMDVFFDPAVTDFDDNDWVIVRTRRNKWDLVQSFPDKKEDILAQGQESNNVEVNQRTSHRTDMNTDDISDQIEVFELFHRATVSVPNGRYMLFTEDGVSLIDREMDVPFIPVEQLTAGDDPMSQMGYSSMNDLAAMQQILNAQYSAIASNHENLAIPVILVPDDSDISVEALEGQYNFVKYGGTQAPQVMDMLQESPEIFNFIPMIEKAMGTLTGISDVVRGNIENPNIPGVSIALQTQQSLEFQNHLQQQYVRFVENVGAKTVKLYQLFSDPETILDIVGEKYETAVDDFFMTDFDDIPHIAVTFGNPLARTLSGRTMLAEYVAKIPGITLTLRDMITILETGDLSVLVDHEVAATELIEKENEMLRSGDMPRVMLTDDHRNHILKHAAIMDDPALREPGNAVSEATDAHIRMHIEMLNDPSMQQLEALLGHAQGAPGAPVPGQEVAPQLPQGAALPEQLTEVSGAGGLDVRNPVAPRIDGQPRPGQQTLPTGAPL